MTFSLSFEDNAPPTSAQTVLTTEFDHCIWGADVREVWQAMAAAGSVLRPNPEMAVVTSTAGIEQVLQNPAIFSSNPDAMYFGSETGAIPLQIDPPDHSPYRKMLDPLFSPRRMAEREQEVAAFANQLIDTFVERGSCDFSTEFALPFPSIVFLRLMGMPTDKLDEFVKAKEGMIRPVGETDADRQAMQMETGAWIFQYFASALDAHPEDDTSDVLGTFLALEQEGRLTRDETLNICLLMLAAGLDTVTDTLECSFAFLAQSPAHQQQLADEPDLAAAAVEEFLRFETPVPTVARITMADTEIDGCPVAAGVRVRPILGIANVDPAVHGDPDVVDFARPTNKHLAFGAGVHRCVGSHLARLELRVALREWHRRIPSYRLADGHVVEFSQGLREIVHLPIEFPAK